jgi:hypothetical protein
MKYRSHDSLVNDVTLYTKLKLGDTVMQRTEMAFFDAQLHKNDIYSKMQSFPLL